MIMCLGMFTVSVNAEESAVSGELSDALDVLRLLEIIPDYFDYNTPFDSEVSRGEFADVVAKVINFGNYKGTNIYYYDVPKTHYAYDSICILTEMGLISGTREKIFGPDSAIDDAAAYKILLGAMGYGDYILYNGGYPAGCISAAKKADILIESSTPKLTYAEMFKMIYKALDAEILKPVSFGSDGSYTSKASDGDTLLSLYRDIYREEGVLNGADMISLSDKSLSSEDEVLIDDILYVSDLELTQYLGEEIEFYYHDDDTAGKKTVIWVKNKGTSNVLNVEADGDVSFDESTFTYSYIDGNERKIHFDRGMLLIYNGKAVEGSYKDILNMQRYTAKFIKTDGAYKTAIVSAYENYVVDTVNTNDEVVYDKINASRMLKLKESLYDYIKIKKIDGSEAAISDISSGNTLSVFASTDNTRMEIIISSDVRSGTVKGISNDDGDYIITVGDTTYTMPQERYTNNFKVGDSIKMYIDYKGLVAAADVEGGGKFAAYIAAVKKSTSLDDNLQIKLFKSDGTMAVYDCEDKIKLDGKSKCDCDYVIRNLSENGNFVPQLALISASADGKIKEIDTAFFNSALEQEESTLQLNMDYEQRHYKIQGYFNFEAAINDQTIIFSVPMNASDSDDDDYRIKRKSELKDDTKHNVMSYNIGNDSGYEQYVVIKEAGSMDYEEDLPVLVKDKGESLNKDGISVESITGYQGKNLVTVLSDGELSFKDVKPGMLIRLRYKRDGSAAGKLILFDPENPDGYYTTTAPFNNIYGVEVGFVNNVIGDVIKIGYGSGENVNHVTNMYAAPPVLIYDKDNKKEPAYVGSFADAKRYKNVGDNCSTVVLITKHCTPRLYVFYN